MPYHIDSNESNSNVIYDDIWSFSSSLRGSYTVNAQYFGVGDIPWMWNGCHQLHVISGTSAGTISFDYANIGTSTNIANIATSFQNSINDVVNALPDSRTCIVSYTSDTTGTYFTFTFNDLVTLSFANGISTVKYVFNKTDNITSTAFTINTTYINTDPKFLEMYIAESITQYYNARGTYPTLLLSTKDTEFTGQEIVFREAVSNLNISIYRCNVPIVCPITNKWDIILS